MYTSKRKIVLTLVPLSYSRSHKWTNLHYGLTSSIEKEFINHSCSFNYISRQKMALSVSFQQSISLASRPPGEWGGERRAAPGDARHPFHSLCQPDCTTNPKHCLGWHYSEGIDEVVGSYTILHFARHHLRPLQLYTRYISSGVLFVLGKTSLRWHSIFVQCLSGTTSEECGLRDSWL